MPFMPTPSEDARNNYNVLRELLKRISYKPGWMAYITEEPYNLTFTIRITYETYESENASCVPITTPHAGRDDLERSYAIAARLLGKPYRKIIYKEIHRTYHRMDLEQMSPDSILKYFIAEPIKEAEMLEFERWFKIDGDRIYGK